MEWPAALIEELAARRCIVFLGAGASAGCLSEDETQHPPLWGDFLTQLKSSLPDGTDTAVVDGLIEKACYLDAAEIIVNRIASADFTRIIRELFIQPRYQPSKIHEAILDIDPKIVITTNYDDIYDKYCQTGMARDGYNICRYYDSHLVADLRSPVRLVIKAHGCVSEPSRIVLTRSQYFRQKQHYSSFYTVLDSLFLTHTLLFVGYSLSDPDIQLILENVNIAAPSTHPHYALIPDDMPNEIEQAYANAYNIQFFKHSPNDYSEVEQALNDLSSAVQQCRVSNPA